MTVVFGLGSLLKNRYLIRQIIATNPVKQIYLVEDRSHSGELCILSEFVAKQRVTIATTMARLQPQLERLHQITHAQIRQLKDWFWQEDRLFIVQSYLEGNSYQQLWATAAISAIEIKELFAGILPVLSYLHERQLYCHQITPDNLWRQRLNKMPILGNLGIIRSIECEIANHRLPISLIDKLAALPIEFASDADRDLYALAVTAILLLTKQDIPTLFDFKSLTWQWQQWRSIDPNLAALIDRMLSPQATARFANADVICNRLKSLTIVETKTLMLIPSKSNWKQRWKKRLFPIILAILTTSSTNLTWIAVVILGILPISIGIWSFDFSHQVYPHSVRQQSLSSIERLRFFPSTQTALTQERAIEAIAKWQTAKQSLLYPPYDRSLAAKILTGKAYEINIKKSDGGESSVEWLENRSAYYVFGTQNIDRVRDFVVKGDRASIQVVFTEQRTLYNKYDRPDSGSSGFDTNLIRYDLELEDGQWKIADYEIID